MSAYASFLLLNDKHNGIIFCSPLAGGRGALTFHLLLRCGVRATLVEPRPAKWSRSQHREVQVAAAAAAMPPLAPGELTLPQLRRRIEPALWRYGAGGVGSDSGCGGGDDDEDTVRKLLLGCSMKRTGAEPEGLHAQTLLLTSLSKPQLLAPPPSSNSSYSSYSTASVADPFPAQWVPVETYSQLLSYILQRAQLYGGWGNSTCREGSGGGGGRGENHHPLSMTSWWRHQEVWLQLWRLASGGSKQGKVVQSPDQVRSRGLRPVRNPYPGPNQNLDLRPDSDSDWGLHLEHDSCLEATVELRSRYSQQLVSGQVPPRSSCTFTLRWLEEQAERWERDVGAGPVSPAATITTAADDAGSKRQNHAEPEANLASEALAPSLAAVRSAGTATGDMPPLRDCRRESGMGKGMYWDINVTGSNAGIEGAGCWKANLSRSLGSGEPAVTRLMFQGANQVVYRLPSVLVDVVT
ncbi:hypothetical protein Vafri_21834 [Volvox africanus]|uniref:Uncharacterized protein n=1 Tax=Volvox africanus TaxID=51714 RepID=A0A8J4FFA0_9CHLO|nr:hypothetical protein Vafri_21834 [Volvox africanus]